jgi:NTP pyrophosphatase (non-canonical NTP hydrolase)
MSDQDILNWVYPAFVDQACTLSDPRERQLLAAMGLMSEAGELGDVWKKHLFHGKPLDEEAMILEMGDVLWYFVLMCIDNGISFQEIMERNMAKLKARKARIDAEQELSEASIG